MLTGSLQAKWEALQKFYAQLFSGMAACRYQSALSVFGRVNANADSASFLHQVSVISSLPAIKC